MRRAFLADVDNLNFLAIGKHQTKEANATNYFNGQLDELQIFERVLTGGEIQYLYNVGKEQGVQRAILSPQVDAIGTVTVTNVGAGYKEVPEVDFNVTSYFGQDGFTAPAGEVELNATSVDQILLTKDFDKTVKILLPDTREILRTSAEYVMVDPNNSRAVIPIGLFGYSSPPNLILEGSPGWPDERNATGYSLFFIDENQSGEVVHGGAGYDLNNSRYIHSFTDDTNTTTYEIIKLRKTWRQAAEIAVLRGGKLAEVNGTVENNLIFNGLMAAGLNTGSTVAPDGGGGAYVWLGGNDFANEGNWTWDGKNVGNGIQFWDGNQTDGNNTNNYEDNWGTLFGVQNEPDDFLGARRFGLDGWPLGSAGQWNDLDENNTLYFVVEYNSTINDVGLAVGFDSDAVRIFGEGIGHLNLRLR